MDSTAKKTNEWVPAFQPGMFPGGNYTPEIGNSPGNFLQAAIS